MRIDGGQIYEPALQKFPNGTRAIGRPSVRSTPVDDVYLALLDAKPGDPIRLRVIVAPLVIWLWIGGITMAVGTVMAAFPGRRRRGTEPVSADGVRSASGDGDGRRDGGGEQGRDDDAGDRDLEPATVGG